MCFAFTESDKYNIGIGVFCQLLSEDVAKCSRMSSRVVSIRSKKYNEYVTTVDEDRDRRFELDQKRKIVEIYTTFNFHFQPTSQILIIRWIERRATLTDF